MTDVMMNRPADFRLSSDTADVIRPFDIEAVTTLLNDLNIEPSQPSDGPAPTHALNIPPETSRDLPKDGKPDVRSRGIPEGTPTQANNEQELWMLQEGCGEFVQASKFRKGSPNCGMQTLPSSFADRSGNQPLENFAFNTTSNNGLMAHTQPLQPVDSFNRPTNGRMVPGRPELYGVSARNVFYQPTQTSMHAVSRVSLAVPDAFTFHSSQPSSVGQPDYAFHGQMSWGAGNSMVTQNFPGVYPCHYQQPTSQQMSNGNAGAYLSRPHHTAGSSHQSVSARAMLNAPSAAATHQHQHQVHSPQQHIQHQHYPQQPSYLHPPQVTVPIRNSSFLRPAPTVPPVDVSITECPDELPVLGDDILGYLDPVPSVVMPAADALRRLSPTGPANVACASPRASVQQQQPPPPGFLTAASYLQPITSCPPISSTTDVNYTAVNDFDAAGILREFPVNQNEDAFVDLDWQDWFTAVSTDLDCQNQHHHQQQQQLLQQHHHQQPLTVMTPSTALVSDRPTTLATSPAGGQIAFTSSPATPSRSMPRLSPVDVATFGPETDTSLLTVASPSNAMTSSASTASLSVSLHPQSLEDLKNHPSTAHLVDALSMSQSIDLTASPPPLTTVAKTPDEKEKAQRRAQLLSTERLLQQNSDGDSVLHAAIINTERHYADALLDRYEREGLVSTIINMRNTLQQSPICLAVLMNETPIVERLLGLGADAKDQIRTEQRTGIKYDQLIHFAASNGPESIDILRLLLQAPNINISVLNSDGRSPLHCAVESHGRMTSRRIPIDATATIELLVNSGANLNQPDGPCEKTPLHYAIEKKDVALVKQLLELVVGRTLPQSNKSLVAAMLSARTGTGNAALHMAVSLTRISAADKRRLVQLLLSRGADPSAKNGDGQLPREMTSDIEVIKLLKGQSCGSPSQRQHKISSG